jgi:metal transporter CNNM
MVVGVSAFAIVIVLVLLSGLFSGLTLGLLGLDKTELERKMKLGDKRAAKVYSVRKNGNLLLCTLLLGNVAVNSAIAIFLGGIATGIIAGVVSTALIVVFGEILPQAFISRYALAVGSNTVWIVRVFIVVLYPICWPMAKGLDKMLGDEMSTVWSHNELKEIIAHHRRSKNSKLDSDEERIVIGALSFSDKIVGDIMISRSHVSSLNVNEVLDKKLISKMKKFGLSRFPVYEGKIDNIKGILFLRDLVGVSFNKKVKDVYRKANLRFRETDKLDALLRAFIMKRIHLAEVFDKNDEFVGVVSLEDVIEEIFGREIVDETDYFKDIQKGKRVSSR